MENDPAKEKFGGKELSACDLHQAALPLQLSCADLNHRSPAIKVILITIGLTDLYLDHFLGGEIKPRWIHAYMIIEIVLLNQRKCRHRKESQEHIKF